MKIRVAQLVLFASAGLYSAAQNPAAPDTVLQQGISLVQNGDFTRAIPLLKRAVQLDPHSSSANYQLGVALFESGHAGEAIGWLRKAITMDSTDEVSRGYLGDAEMKMREFAGAAEAFEAAVDQSPNSERVLVWWTDFCLERFRTLDLALRATARGRAAVLQVGARDDKLPLNKKEDLLTLAARLDPSLPGLHGELGAAQVGNGKFADAKANLTVAIETEPASSTTLELRALVAASEGHWTDAEAKLNELFLRSPTELGRLAHQWPRALLPSTSNDNSSADIFWTCLRKSGINCSLRPTSQQKDTAFDAEQLFQEGRWEELAALPEQHSEDTHAWFVRGVALARLNDCRRAIVPLERGINAGAEVDGALLADCYKREAIRTADRLQELGKEASVHQIRGDIFLSMRLDAEKAVAEYEKALDLKRDDGPLLEKLAEGYFSEGDMAKARQTAQRALALNPHRTRLLRMIAEIEMNDRNYEAALTVLKPLSELEPQDGWIAVQQGIAYMHTDDAKSAVEKLQWALDHGYSDEKGALHQMLATQLRKLGRVDEAKQAAAEAAHLADLFAEQHSAAPSSHSSD